MTAHVPLLPPRPRPKLWQVLIGIVLIILIALTVFWMISTSSIHKIGSGDQPAITVSDSPTVTDAPSVTPTPTVEPSAPVAATPSTAPSNAPAPVVKTPVTTPVAPAAPAPYVPVKCPAGETPQSIAANGDESNCTAPCQAYDDNNVCVQPGAFITTHEAREVNA